jgi:BirA family biotin operon repressor/biotin-[acetyl-CoA-carboxylase] ligase
MKMNFTSDMRSAFQRELQDSKLFVYETVGSTSDEARKYAREGGKSDAFFIAREQTAGRGRRGRGFVSREGGLYISYLLHPTLKVEDAVMLTVFSAVALSEVIEEVSGVAPGIKWVNDIFLGGKKLAGILAEGEFSEGGEYFEYAVVGIGVNLHGMALPPEIRGIATTLEAECGIKVDIADFALRLAKKLRSFTEIDTASYMDSYRKKSIVIGKKVRMTSAGEEFDAEVIGIDDGGAIRVLLGSGEVKSFSSAEVSVIL